MLAWGDGASEDVYSCLDYSSDETGAWGNPLDQGPIGVQCAAVSGRRPSMDPMHAEMRHR